MTDHCVTIQQELRRINHELFGLQEHCFAMQNDLRGVQQEIRKLNHELFVLQKQSSHASEPSMRPALHMSQASAPIEDFDYGKGQPCNQDPRAPHGFARDASHSAGRYVCECEGWSPDDDDYKPGVV